MECERLVRPWGVGDETPPLHFPTSYFLWRSRGGQAGVRKQHGGVRCTFLLLLLIWSGSGQGDGVFVVSHVPLPSTLLIISFYIS